MDNLQFQASSIGNKSLNENQENPSKLNYLFLDERSFEAMTT